MKQFLILALLATGCAVSPAERWAQATGVTPQAEVIRQDSVFCSGGRKEGCSKPGQIRLSSEADDGTELHELGHQFTKSHLPTGESGVMVSERTNLSWRSCLTQDDLNLVCSVISCLWQKPECK